MIDASDFITACIARGYTFYTGVPCSFLKPLINFIIQTPAIHYVPASSEGEAVGIASGAFLGGKRAVVLCQNSGLGNMVNPITSLNFAFRIPLLLVITLRGAPGLNDEPQHEVMGRITPRLLETLGIAWDYFPNSNDKIEPALDQAITNMKKTRVPFALVMQKGAVGKIALDSQSDSRKWNQNSQAPIGTFRANLETCMTRDDVIKIVREVLGGNYAFIASTGKIGRELYDLGDSENQFYVVGSMGCAAGIGFGIKQGKSNQPVVILDGDGSILMKMGTLATIGHYRPEQFIHIILDNEAYESTGGQRSVSRSVDFSLVAAGCGYLKCFRANTKGALLQYVELAKRDSGSTLIHVKVAPNSFSKPSRPAVKPCQVKRRFMKFLEQQKDNA